MSEKEDAEDEITQEELETVAEPIDQLDEEKEINLEQASDNDLLCMQCGSFENTCAVDVYVENLDSMGEDSEADSVANERVLDGNLKIKNIKQSQQ